MTITNTSAIPVTWHINGDLSRLDIAPTSSTLAGGESIAVSVIPKLGQSVGATLSVDADNAPSQSFSVLANPVGVSIQLPPDIDFGNVPLGSVTSVVIPVPSYTGPWSGAALFGGSTLPFQMSGGAPQPQAGNVNGWLLTVNTIFNPSQPLGPFQTTLSFASTGAPICGPNTFTARAVIVAP